MDGHAPLSSLIVDLFAGGGGTSAGIERALGRPPHLAVNHDAAALAVHAVNHPTTKHLNANVWRVVPRDACGDASVLATLLLRCTSLADEVS